MLASPLVVFVVFCCCDSPDGAVGVPNIQFQCTFQINLFFSMGQRTPRCPAAVSLFAFLGELYVNVNLGPAYPRLQGTVRRRFACVFPFFLFLLPVAIIYSFFVFPPRCGIALECGRVGFSCCCVFRQLTFLILQSKDNIRSVGCRRSGLCIYCAFRWSGQELRSRQPGLACRAQVEGGQGGSRGARDPPGGGTVCRYRRVGRLVRFGQGRGAFGTRP